MGGSATPPVGREFREKELYFSDDTGEPPYSVGTNGNGKTKLRYSTKTAKVSPGSPPPQGKPITMAGIEGEVEVSPQAVKMPVEKPQVTPDMMKEVVNEMLSQKKEEIRGKLTAQDQKGLETLKKEMGLSDEAWKYILMEIMSEGKAKEAERRAEPRPETKPEAKTVPAPTVPPASGKQVSQPSVSPPSTAPPTLPPVSTAKPPLPPSGEKKPEEKKPEPLKKAVIKKTQTPSGAGIVSPAGGLPVHPAGEGATPQQPQQVSGEKKDEKIPPSSPKTTPDTSKQDTSKQEPKRST